MQQQPNKLAQFWQELKRRNVTRVLAVYIAAGFMILELVNMFSEPFGLPDWSLKVAFFILLAGLVIAFIISWVYEIHPEEGIVKTEPFLSVGKDEITTGSNSWKIASYISFVVIVGLIVLNIIPRANNKKEILDKSIAVLPFLNESSDKENSYFINGMMESILDNLCRLEDLRVVSRNSVEQYRNDPKPTPVIAEEMDVSYVLEGSGQKVGKRLLMTVQLIVGEEDRHIWSKQYDRVIERVEDLIDIQKEIAELVVEEIEAIITPEEKELIENVPTTSLSAYNFYQRGIEESKRGNIDRAEELLNVALSYDSTFADAYVGLAEVVISRQDLSDYYSINFMDSVLILANIALSYDEDLYGAYTLRAHYYYITGETSLALKDLDKAIELNPNNADAYSYKGQIYYSSDLLETIKANQKSVSIDRTADLNWRLINLGFSYITAGFSDKSYYYYKEALKLDGDSADYFASIGELEYWQGNLDESIELYRRSLALDSTYPRAHIYLAKSLCELGRCEESLEYVVKYIDLSEEQLGYIAFDQSHRVAYVYWQNGLKEEAEYYFNQQIEICEGAINSNRPWAQKYYSYYDLADVYAFKGEKEKAIENLRILNQIQRVPYWLPELIKRDELLESLHDEPEFQQIVRDLEAKYQAEHERVRKWLEENDML